MASEKLSTIAGVSNNLIMPQLSVGQVEIKASATSAPTSTSAAFFTAIDLDHSDQGYESASLDAVSDTSEQTIVDISGAGVLTHVLAPELVSAGVMTVRVTIDGSVHTFISPSFSAANVRLCVGHFPWVDADASTSISTAPFGARDSGYDNTAAARASMSTPHSAIVAGIGMKFETALKVTVQGSVNIETLAERKKAAVAYLTSIPFGV